MSRLRVALVGWLLVAAAAAGQTGKIAVRGAGGSGVPLAAGAMPATMRDALAQMAAGAEVIFAGHVEAVTRQDAAGYVDVQFRVEQAVRGCGGASVYVLREWAGLWVGGMERYRTGQRLLMLLTGRGKSGMSAPVGGMDGAIPLVGTGMQPLANAAGIAATDDGTAVDEAGSVGADLRWVGARVARGAAAGGAAGKNGARRAEAMPVAGGPDSSGGVDSGNAGGGWAGPAATLSSVRNMDGGAGDVPVKLSSVLTLLQSATGGSGAQ